MVGSWWYNFQNAGTVSIIKNYLNTNAYMASTKTFVIQAQQAPVDIIKGKIELKYLEGSCVLIIDIVPKNDKDIVLNGSHTVARCSKT